MEPTSPNLWTLLFETENHRFRLDERVKPELANDRGMSAFAREMEEVWGFRLVLATRKKDSEVVWTNPDRTPLPPDGKNLGHISVSWPTSGLVTILFNRPFDEERRALLADIFDRYFVRQACAATWNTAMDFVCSKTGERAVHNFRKSHRHVTNRTLPSRVEANEARNRFRTLFREIFERSGLQLVQQAELPCEPEAKVEFYHAPSRSFFDLILERDHTDLQIFTRERWIDRHLQLEGYKIFRFTASEFADADKSRSLIDDFRINFQRHVIERKPWHLPVRVDLATRTRTSNLKHEYDLLEPAIRDPEAFAHATEELLGWRVIRIAVPGSDGLARWVWRHPEPACAPPDDVDAMYWVSHCPARSALTFIPSNKDGLNHDAVVDWLKRYFAPMGDPAFVHAKVIAVKSRSPKPGNPLHRKLLTRREGFDSRYEALLAAALHRAELDPESQRVVYDREQILTILDFVYPAEHVAVMADGHACHSSPAAVIRDRVQDRMLQFFGFVILRYPNHSLDLDLDACVEQIRDAVMARKNIPR